LYIGYNLDVKKAEQTVERRGLELEQFEYLMLGYWVDIWFDDGRTGLLLT
jgi:hypothetical protein